MNKLKDLKSKRQSLEDEWYKNGIYEMKEWETLKQEFIDNDLPGGTEYMRRRMVAIEKYLADTVA